MNPEQREKQETYQQSVEDVIALIDSNAQSGLSEAEAKTRLQQYGKNELTSESPTPAWKKFLAQFKDLLVILLLIATGKLAVVLNLIYAINLYLT